MCTKLELGIFYTNVYIFDSHELCVTYGVSVGFFRLDFIWIVVYYSKTDIWILLNWAFKKQVKTINYLVNFQSTMQIYISLYEIIKFWIEWLNFHYYIMLSWAHLNQRLNWTFLCGKCPLSVCPSVRPCPYIFNFSHFLFL